VALRLLERGVRVLGLDNLNDYYSVPLKNDRVGILRNSALFEQATIDIADSKSLERAFGTFRPRLVVHLAAQAGIRYSLQNPAIYVQSNLVGFANVLEACRRFEVEHLVYASSSSVYGNNTKVPFSESDRTDHPISLYAATKKSNELMAYTYSHLFGMRLTGLRFFTVYGPWYRPDMAIYKFTKALYAGEPIALFNYGDVKRDFTYIDDVVEAVLQLLTSPAANETETAPIYNVGNRSPVKVTDLVCLLEEITGRTAILEFLPMQPGDLLETYASTESLTAATGFSPSTSLREGLSRFVDWYREYHGIQG